MTALPLITRRPDAGSRQPAGPGRAADPTRVHAGRAADGSWSAGSGAAWASQPSSEAAAGCSEVTARARTGTSSPATTQPTRNSADIANVLVNPVAVGRPCTMFAAPNVAAIWPPSAPPSPRGTVFTPLRP